MATFDQKKPLLLYISGDDKNSKIFEQHVLTKDGIIMLMDDNFHCLGLNAQSNDGSSVRKSLDPNQRIPCALIMKIDKEKSLIEIKYMLEGESLHENEGETYFEFLT